MSIYWISVIDGINNCFDVLCIVLIILMMFGWAGCYLLAERDDELCDLGDNKNFFQIRLKQIYPWIFISLIFSSIINVFIPSDKVLMQHYIFEEVKQVKNIELLPEKSVKLLNKLLDEYLSEDSK